ncbi:hypothetical protein MJO29_006347 [Puccinia striiformis f. sp. tritici]|uniref:Uncharacterized protein n=1 Tax=Puccinia striiformis f. sp. tritici PST-78 TaxID=1165861 RepID=A0A0L0V9P0_9BASI|nr:hypothetical protein MJO29_006347 [Puccinia striiformis f. sp. tritici]KNE95921.1 hypothetical protein PSTG_10720 [Puccinia striiformis f. sp. tritici PST-78]
MSNPESEKNSKGKHPQQVVVQDISVRQGGGTELQSATAVRTTDKILAACAGGCLTSLTMTPLDVVKTRLQTQSQPFSSGTDQYQVINRHCYSQQIGASSSHINHDRFSGCTDSHRTWNGIRQSAFSNLRGQPSTNHPLTHPSLCLNGPCTSSTASTTTLNHLLHEHQLSQVYPSRQSPSSNGTLATLLQIVRLEGISSLWRGIAPSLMISIPAQAIYMLGYDTLRSTFLELVPLSDRNGSSSASSPAQLIPLASGILSRSFVAILFSPLELIRTRLQSTPAVKPQVTRIAPFEHNGLRGSGGNSRPIISMILGSVRSTGLRSLYAGLPATLWRDVPFSGIYWSSYEAVRRILSGGLGFGEADHRASVHQLALQSFCAGSLSGALAATLTNPFDVVKTRRQASPLLLPNHSLSPTSSTSSSSTSSHTRRPPGTIRIILQIARSEGVKKGLMRGLSPRLAKIIPSCGIMIASYEGLAQVLSKY